MLDSHTAYRMHAFNQSLKYDKRMYTVDIRGSIAYAKALSRVGILTENEANTIVNGLTDVGKEWDTGTVSSPSFRVTSTPD